MNRHTFKNVEAFKILKYNLLPRWQKRFAVFPSFAKGYKLLLSIALASLPLTSSKN
jgi:hypothetical protein